MLIAALAIGLVAAFAMGLLGTTQAEAYCPIDQPCPQEPVTRSASTDSLLEEWEHSVQHFAYRMERGVLQMAGVPRI